MYVIKSPLEYFPIKVGDFNLIFNKNKNEFGLYEKNRPWMGYNKNTHWQSTEFYIEIQEAKGVCITTGLGLGILQAHLCLKQDVTKVIVYEKSGEIIEMFYKIIEFNKFEISKIEIKNKDADNISDEKCDCLFADHFELESEEYVIDMVRNLSNNNQTNLIWYWPAGHHFLKFAMRKKLDISSVTYGLWKNYTKIKNLPKQFNDDKFLYFEELKRIYQKDVLEGRMKNELDILDQRNALLKLKQKLR